MPVETAPPPSTPAPVATPGFVQTPDAPASSDRPSINSLIQKAADKGAAPKTPETPKAKEAPKQPEPPKKDAPKAPEQKQEASKTEQPKTPEAKPPTEAPKGKLSDVLHAKEKEVKELRAELEKARSSKPADDPEKKALSERLTKAEQRAKELEDEFRYVNYEKSTEFREKYQQPYENLQKQLQSEALELIVETADGSARSLTAEEFWNVATQPDLNSAVKAARELFPDEPDKRNILLDYRKQIKRSWETMNAAKQEYRTKGAEREQQKQQQLAELSKKEKADYQSEVEALAEQSPQYFKPGEDAKENEIREKAEKVVDAALDSDKPNLKHVARIRQAAIAFPIVKARLEKALARTAELEAKIAEYEKSIPADGKVEGQPEVKEMTMDEKIARRATQ